MNRANRRLESLVGEIADVVTFMKLDGNLIPGTSRWDEKTRQIVVEAQS
jgi:hypothetical protein